MDQGLQDGRFSSPSASGSGAGYLPQYLLGSNSSASSPLPRGWSAGSSFKKSPMVVSPQPATRGSVGYGFSSPVKSSYGKDQMDRTSTSRNTPSMGRTPKDMISAPPVEGLYDSRDTATSVTPFRWSHDHQQMQTDSPPEVFSPSLPSTQRMVSPTTPGNTTTAGLDSKLFSPRHGTTPPSPAQIDPFYTQGEAISSVDLLDDCWVTVFGFPPAATSFILQQFAQYGHITRHVVSTNGNWMHLQFQSKLQAKKALSKNGKIYGSGIMIGVMPCIEKTVIGNREKENLPMTPTRDEFTRTAPSKMPIRPLTAAYQAASSEHQVVPHDNRTPQKNSNALSKAMEYMFGW